MEKEPRKKERNFFQYCNLRVQTKIWSKKIQKLLKYFNFCWTLSKKFSVGLSKLRSTCAGEHFEQLFPETFATVAARNGQSPEKRSLDIEGRIFLSEFIMTGNKNNL